MKQRSVHPTDLLHIPTAITAGSFALVCDGSRHIDTRRGKIEVVVGRLGDLADGYAARSLGLTSDAGAIADAACDKVGMAVISSALWTHNTAPKPVLLAIAARNLLNAGAALQGLHDPAKRPIRPSKSGKYAMAADNLSLGAFMVAEELQNGTKGYKVARGIGYIAAAAGVVFGYNSTKRYLAGDFDTA